MKSQNLTYSTHVSRCPLRNLAIACVIVLAAFSVSGCGGKEKDFETLKSSAMSEIGSGEYEKARKDLQKALKLKPADKDALLYLGIANAVLNQHDTAISYYRKVMKLYGPERETAEKMIQSATAIQDWDSAVEGLEDIVKSGVERSTLYDRFYDLYMSAGYYQAASNVLDTMIKLNPERKNLYLHSATAKGALGEYGKAEMILQEAIRRFGPSVEAYNNMGVLKMHQGQQKKAEIFFRKAYAIDSTSDETLLNLGNCLSSTDDRAKKREAINCFRRMSQKMYDRMRMDTLVAKLEFELQN